MRKLSKFQKTPWMKKISKLPRKWPDRRGEKNPMCRLTDEEVMLIRSNYGFLKEMACWFGISKRYVYQLWAGERRK